MSRRAGLWLLVPGVVAALVLIVWAWAAWTRPVRESVWVYTGLIAAANRQDVAAARRLCSARYAATHPLSPAPDGGLVGLPRNIHIRFQAWRQGPHVWLCPTNRVGPVYQFVLESNAWRFDGPVGILRGRNQFVPLDDAAVTESR